MTRITGTYYLDLYSSNDNCIVQKPVFVGFEFKGYEVVKQPLYEDGVLFLGV